MCYVLAWIVACSAQSRMLSWHGSVQVMLEDGFALFGQFIKWLEAGVLSGNVAANTEEVIYLRDPVNPWVSPDAALCKCAWQ